MNDDLVSTEWLADHLDDPELVVVDMRWRTDGSGRRRYERGHLPGAVYLDWTTDIVDPDHHIAFMLAPPVRFAAAMDSLGIGDDTTVVAYADDQGSGPFRLWWAFRVYGHHTVRVLDGGFPKWTGEGRPLSLERSALRLPPAPWTPRPGADLRCGPDEVAGAADAGVTVLDSRPPEQFRGEAVWFERGPVPAGRDGVAHTPRGDLRAGHVPGARNVPVNELYRPDHTLKPPDELRELFAGAGLQPGHAAITYCGVGISAAGLLFALNRAGYRDARLYDASWEEWGRDLTRPVAREI